MTTTNKKCIRNAGALTQSQTVPLGDEVTCVIVMASGELEGLPITRIVEGSIQAVTLTSRKIAPDLGLFCDGEHFALADGIAV